MPAGAMLIVVFEGFNEEARSAIYAAQAGSRRLASPSAGSEHLLLGVMSVDSGASRALEGLGVAAGEVERAVASGGGQAIAEDGSVRWTRACLPLFETCLRNRLDHGGGPIGVEYLAMALTYDRYGAAGAILVELARVEASALRSALMHRLGLRSWSEPLPSSLESPLARGDGTGSASPEQVVLRGFRPEDGARVVEVRYEAPSHAVVQVGFLDKAAFYWFNVFRHDDGWRLDRPW